MSSNNDLFQDAMAVASEWQAPLLLNLSTSIDDENYVPVDVTATLKRKKGGKTTRRNLLDGAYYFPPHLNSISDEGQAAHRKHVFKEGNESLMRLVAGTFLKLKGAYCQGIYTKDYNCFRCVYAQQSDNPDMKTKSNKPQRELGEVLCPFRFKVYFDESTNRYFLPKKQAGNPLHKGHIRKTAVTEMQVDTSAIDAEVQKVLAQLRLVGSPAAILRAWFRHVEGRDITRHQARHLTDRLLESDPLTNCPLDETLEQMKEDPTVRAIWLTGEKNSTGLITVRQTARTREEDARILASRSNSRSTNGEENSLIYRQGMAVGACDGDDEDRENPNDETALTYTERKIRGMRLQGSKYLLSLAWMLYTAFEMLQTHPYVIGVDEIEKTNKDDRPLFTAVSRDANKKNIPWFQCFMPNKRLWAYQWLFLSVFPKLLPQSVRDRVQVIMSDNCHECVSTIDRAISNDIFKNAVHRLCAWHVIDRNYVKPCKSRCRHHPPAHKQADEKFRNACKEWFFSFTNGTIKNSIQEDDSLQQLHIFIENAIDVNLPLIEFTIEYIYKTFKPALPRIRQRAFDHVKGGSVSCDGFVEGENGVLRKSPSGPNATLRLSESLRRMRRMYSERMERMRKEKGNDIDTTHNLSQVEGDDPVALLRQSLSKTIVDFPLKQCLDHFTNASFYVFTKCKRSDLPRRSIIAGPPPIGEQFIYLVTNTNKSQYNRNTVYCTYRTTYVVSCLKWQGREYLTCSCGTATRDGHCCRHIYACIARLPNENDFYFDCRKDYTYGYSKMDSVAKAARIVSERQKPGWTPIRLTEGVDELNGVTNGTQYNFNELKDGTADISLNWFLKPLEFVVRHQNSPKYKLAQERNRTRLEEHQNRSRRGRWEGVQGGPNEFYLQGVFQEETEFQEDTEGPYAPRPNVATEGPDNNESLVWDDVDDFPLPDDESQSGQNDQPDDNPDSALPPSRRYYCSQGCGYVQWAYGCTAWGVCQSKSQILSREAYCSVCPGYCHPECSALIARDDEQFSACDFWGIERRICLRCCDEYGLIDQLTEAVHGAESEGESSVVELKQLAEGESHVVKLPPQKMWYIYGKIMGRADIHAPDSVHNLHAPSASEKNNPLLLDNEEFVERYRFCTKGHIGRVPVGDEYLYEIGLVQPVTDSKNKRGRRMASKKTVMSLRKKAISVIDKVAERCSTKERQEWFVNVINSMDEQTQYIHARREKEQRNSEYQLNNNSANPIHTAVAPIMPARSKRAAPIGSPSKSDKRRKRRNTRGSTKKKK